MKKDLLHKNILQKRGNRYRPSFRNSINDLNQSYHKKIRKNLPGQKYFLPRFFSCTLWRMILILLEWAFKFEY